MCIYILDDGHSTRLDTTKTKVVPWSPDEKFTHVQNVDKNMRSRTQLDRIQTKQGMMDKQNGKHRVKRKHQRLKPWQDTLSQRAGKKQVGQRLNRSTTKTRKGDWQTKRRKMLSSVEDTVGNLPIKVNDLTIKIKKEQRPPCSWPVKRTKHRVKRKHQRLKPRQDTLSQRAGKKQVGQSHSIQV